MNWLDIVVLVLLGAGGLLGLRAGLIGALVAAGGVIVGVLFAGQLSDDVGEWLTDSISNDTLVTVVSYVIIIGAVIAATWLCRRILRRLISMVFLGWADRLGGAALGVLAGAVISAALITGMARFAYDFSVPSTAPAQQVYSRWVAGPGVQEWVEGALTGSSVVPIFVDVADAIPAGTLGFVPSDFEVALDILERRLGEG